ncbi:hypothetical protein CEP52_007894 [Fusarium oligoseptatum]|uniref:Arginase n=1 Tax=Fusarium oligoseptatum TaxID=2604345 RepID=A0A428TKT5_9HYPO|nr:hypothetical protein CEP52_007894 [Fusarium oligoseptatum]
MAASSSISITYVPADCGSIIPGKSKAPQAFQDVGIVAKLRDAGLQSVSEYHALESPARFSVATLPLGGVRNEPLNIAVCQQVRRAISRNLGPSTSKAPFQLILGGECCMLPAILSAFWEHASLQSPPKRVGLIYIDADTDLSSPIDLNSTGTFAGMNMTHLIRARGALNSMKQFLQPSQEPETSRNIFAYLFDNNYKVVSSASVACDPEYRAKEALEYLNDNVDVIMVHLDVDAIDPQMFPLANVPNFTGVKFEQMMRALRVFLSSEKVGGLTIAEVNPDHDPGLEMVERLTQEVVGMLAARNERG